MDSAMHSATMLLSWLVLLLFLFANADNMLLWQKSGENVTLACSFTACPRSIDGIMGMYWYHYSLQAEEVLYYHSSPGHEKITPRFRYLKRVGKKGFLKNHTITISKLNVADSGVYSCVYKKKTNIQVICNNYTLFVSGVAQCPTSQNATRVDIIYKSPDLLVIIFATCAISIFATLVFILLILRVKQCTQRRRRACSVPIDNEYEVMSKNPLTAPE